MPGVFLSYRDGDGAYCALIKRALSSQIGSRNVFRDSDSITPGEDYASRLRAALSECDIMLAVIGPQWLDKIEAPGDWVRREIVEALDREIPVIPVLVDGAVQPTATDLPDGLKKLASRQSLPLRHRYEDGDTRDLITAVLSHLPDLILSLDYDDAPAGGKQVYDALRQVVDPAHDWEVRQDAKGRGLIRVPATTPPARVLGVWIERFQETLRNNNSPRVRLGVHTGKTDADADLAWQLARSAQARELSASAHRAHVVVLVSDRVYRSVVRNGGRGVDADFYHGVQAAGAQAWVTVPGWTVPPAVTGTRPPDNAEPDHRGSIKINGDNATVIQAGRDVHYRGGTP